MPSDGNWNDPANWVPMIVPNNSGATAVFDVSDTTSLFFTANTAVDGLTFDAGAPDYSFNLNPNDGSVVNVMGAGIVNNSANAPSFTIGNFAVLAFFNTATAAGANITNNVTGFATFIDSATKSVERTAMADRISRGFS